MSDIIDITAQLKGARFSFATRSIPSVTIDIKSSPLEYTHGETVYKSLRTRFAKHGLRMSYARQTDDGKLDLYFEGEDPETVLKAVGEMWRGH